MHKKLEFIFEKSFSNLFVFVMAALLLFSAAFGAGSYTVQQHAISEYRNQLEQTRREFDKASNRQSAIEAITYEAIQYVDRADSIYSESISTVGELRTQFEEVRKYTECLEKYIYSIRSYSIDGNNDSSNNRSEQ